MSSLLVGNDVVDLSDPRCRGKAGHSRFVARVFDSSEVDLIRNAERPDEMLWLLWAGKEAAFKVVSKGPGGPPPFVHASFVVTLDEVGPDRARGTVSYGAHRLPFHVDLAPGHLHAVCWFGSGVGATPPGRLRWAARALASVLPDGTDSEMDQVRTDRFTVRERDAVHSPQSAAVRIAARDAVAHGLGVDAALLEIVCEGGSTGRTPPRLYEGGQPSTTDVSLSHHGSLVGWAAAFPTEADGS